MASAIPFASSVTPEDETPLQQWNKLRIRFSRKEQFSRVRPNVYAYDSSRLLNASAKLLLMYRRRSPRNAGGIPLGNQCLGQRRLYVIVTVGLESSRLAWAVLYTCIQYNYIIYTNTISSDHLIVTAISFCSQCKNRKIRRRQIDKSYDSCWKPPNSDRIRILCITLKLYIF